MHALTRIVCVTFLLLVCPPASAWEEFLNKDTPILKLHEGIYCAKTAALKEAISLRESFDYSSDLAATLANVFVHMGGCTVETWGNLKVVRVFPPTRMRKGGRYMILEVKTSYDHAFTYIMTKESWEDL